MKTHIIPISEIIKLINKMKKRSTIAWGKFPSKDYVIEQACPKNINCDVCDGNEIYILDAEELIKRIEAMK